MSRASRLKMYRDGLSYVDRAVLQDLAENGAVLPRELSDRHSFQYPGSHYLMQLEIDGYTERLEEGSYQLTEKARDLWFIKSFWRHRVEP